MSRERKESEIKSYKNAFALYVHTKCTVTMSRNKSRLRESCDREDIDTQARKK